MLDVCEMDVSNLSSSIGSMGGGMLILLLLRPPLLPPPDPVAWVAALIAWRLWYTRCLERGNLCWSAVTSWLL